jgi:hypothetical protein
MQVYVTVQAAVLQALLDSGLTHNFVDSEAAARVGIKFSSRAGFSVAVANGDRVESSGSCTDLKINIAGEPFIIACYGPSLGSYETILDVQWLESLGPVLWDFTHRTLSFLPGWVQDTLVSFCTSRTARSCGGSSVGWRIR